MTLQVITSHVAYIIAEAERRVGESKRAIIETTVEAEETYSGEIMRRAAWFASIGSCTPSYITSEGESSKIANDPAARMKAARSGNWAEGMESFLAFLQQWKDKGSLCGLEVKSANT